ncbi:hypothetical protein IEU95_15335 [Hoyosella rhizosphaerae]|uniref:Uncharacterized protein n=1 Tax=Hoyosella rhizosphaerae TaxID=1755582 RepID=A0A916UIM4_9ACTN|nr:hypothetical protein [Hoyosella rhizosphaerae]MBN4928210.1 hypothetical protein [Hoyosella rhizosphaerae]GGC73245.1 hypothetical protein GCM10011410_27960 [Hoyosella rhizosphaerae]
MEIAEMIELFATFSGGLADIGAFFDGVGGFTSGSADLLGGYELGFGGEDGTFAGGEGFLGSMNFFSLGATPAGE